MGEVYRARDTKLKRDVALKFLPDSVTDDPDRLAASSARREVLASLNHPHIGHIHGLEESDGVRALVLELVEGPTLADRIAQGPVPINEALAIARQIADALDAAHEKGIVHRDLKPANIKITPGRRRQGPRLRPGTTFRSRLGARRHGVTDRDGPGHTGRRDSRDGGVHEPRAGAGPACGQADGRVGLWLRPLRDARRTSRLQRRHGARTSSSPSSDPSPTGARCRRRPRPVSGVCSSDCSRRT